MKKFDTKVQYIKYRVLREVASYYWDGTLMDHVLDIPRQISPDNTPSIRCCVYKERAIIAERIKKALGEKRKAKNPIEVIKIACDECPVGGYEVTAACRGCLAHRCEEICRFGAITFDHNHVAHIDKVKCVECGQCAKVCPFSAITNHVRPCQSACKVDAISINAENIASIDHAKCIACGMCVYQCPFGAIVDKSQITEAIDLLKQQDEGTKVYAVVAPSIASQYTYAKLGQVITGLKQLGFHGVVEAALGADFASKKEAKELVEKGFLMSSCCPAFAEYVKKEFPDLACYLSETDSPMVLAAKHIKSYNCKAKVVFIGPCTAKKMEEHDRKVNSWVDVVLTFEELQALFDCRNIAITELEETSLDQASYFGRIFARSGGVTEAITQALTSRKEEFSIKPLVCNGIEECRKTLLLKQKERLEANFVEGMICKGGCIGGSGCLTHGMRNHAMIDLYAEQAKN